MRIHLYDTVLWINSWKTLPSHRNALHASEERTMRQIYALNQAYLKGKGQWGKWTLQTRHTSKKRPAREMNTLNQLYLKGKGQWGRWTLQTRHTSKERPGRQMNAPNQAIVAFTKARRAMKAMRLAAMLATSAMDCEAPAAAASSKFLCCLKVKQTKVTTSLLPSGSCVGERGGEWGKQVGSMNEESQVSSCYK